MPLNAKLPDWLRPKPARAPAQSDSSDAVREVASISQVLPGDIDALVERIYELALDRSPKAEETVVWTDLVRGGTLSPGELVVQIAASPEAGAVRERRLAAGLPRPKSLSETPGDIDGLVKRIYELALDRTPNEEEVGFWAGQLHAGAASVGELAERIAMSPEAETVRERRQAAVQPFAASNPSEGFEDLVEWVYEKALDRRPSVEDVSFWTGVLRSGELSAARFVRDIATSSEAEATQERRQAALQPSTPPDDPAHLEWLVEETYRTALDRPPSAEDVAFWTNALRSGELSATRFVRDIATSPEAEVAGERADMCPSVPNGRFVQFVYERVLGRGAAASEIVHWDHLLSTGGFRRDRMVVALFADRAKVEFGLAEPAQVDPGLARILGTNAFVSADHWLQQAEDIGPESRPAGPRRTYPSLATDLGPGIAVSAIASLYKGGDYIEQFLDNITGQTIFRSACELIIVDAASPDNEAEVIARYAERFPNIVYHRADSRIGIYEAWNLGVEKARGRYLTNTNLDDLRRRDSFERQVEVLESLPFVDVVYQDFFYSFDGRASVDRTAAVGVRSELPIVTPYNLMGSNAPHNAPMWRRRLHEEIGMFDTSYRSAGDYDFWLRCVSGGKVFYKLNDPHVVYFVNPEGLSTQPNTRGVDEADRITRTRARQIVSPRLVSTQAEFMGELSAALEGFGELREPDMSVPDWRYRAAQDALRRCSIRSRRRFGAET